MGRVSKYKNKRTVIDGISFASKMEAARYEELKLLVKAGRIKDLLLQPRFKLWVEGKLICTYVGDFIYRDIYDNVVVVEDVKGVKTSTYKIKAKLFQALYPSYRFVEVGAYRRRGA